MNFASSVRFSSSTSSARSLCLPPRRRSTTEAAGRGSSGVPRFGASAGPRCRSSSTLTGPPYPPRVRRLRCGSGRARRARRTQARRQSQARRAIRANGARIARPIDDHPGGDREDAAGIVEAVADAPARPPPSSPEDEIAAGLDPQGDPGEVGAAAERGEPRAQRGDLAALGSAAGLRRRRARSSVSRRASWPSRPSTVARESCSLSPTLTVGAVMSWVDSWRERTSAIEENAASASPTLPLGISSSNLAPASPAAPSRIEELRTMPSAAWTASKTLAASARPRSARRRARSRPSVRRRGARHSSA